MLLARDNPFAADRVLRQRYRFETSDWDAFFDTLRKNAQRGAIVGPHGSGKTTLLEELSVQLLRRGESVQLFRLSADCRHLPPGWSRRVPIAPSFILLDGAEQLGAVSWWRFRRATRSAKGVIITAHRPGRLPTLRVCSTSSSLLQTLVAALGVKITAADAQALHAEHGGNIRETLRSLYDRASAGRLDQ